jgi:hypothetical protein
MGTPFKQGAEVCRTHHGYTITLANDNGQVLIPAGAHYMDIKGNAEAIVYDMAAAKDFDIETNERHIPVPASSAGQGLTECVPGWYINISHSDGSTAIGKLTIVFAGGEDLPTSLTTSTDDS